MFKVKHLFATAAVGVASLVAAASALAWQGPPVANEQFRPPPDVHPATWCGELQGTAVDTIVEHYMQDASGNIIDNVRFTRVFTATATGKSIISSASTTEKSSGPIDNGNGTISFVTAVNGLALKFQIPDGPVLKSADGEPLRSAGVLVFEGPVRRSNGRLHHDERVVPRPSPECRRRRHLRTIRRLPARSLGAHGD